jgi:hypothetical protein
LPWRAYGSAAAALHMLTDELLSASFFSTLPSYTPSSTTGLEAKHLTLVHCPKVQCT